MLFKLRFEFQNFAVGMNEVGGIPQRFESGVANRSRSEVENEVVQFARYMGAGFSFSAIHASMLAMSSAALPRGRSERSGWQP